MKSYLRFSILLEGIIVLNFCFSGVLKGKPLFDTWVEFPVGEYPVSIYLADLDGDGDFDLVTANSLSNSISVLKNKGEGLYPEKVDYLTGDLPVSVVAAETGRSPVK